MGRRFANARGSVSPRFPFLPRCNHAFRHKGSVSHYTIQYASSYFDFHLMALILHLSIPVTTLHQMGGQLIHLPMQQKYLKKKQLHFPK